MRWFQSNAVTPLSELSTAQLRAFLKGYPGDWRRDTDQHLGARPPPIEKPCPADAPRIALAPPARNPAPSADAALFTRLAETRRSCRSFGAAAVSRAALECLLWNTQAVTRIVPDPEGHVDHHFRTVPSGGARHPFETYLLVERVGDLEPGLYRYLPSAHALLPLRETPGLARAASEAAYGQEFMETAALIVIWTTLPARMEWQYAYLAHRMIAIEAGHVCQNLLLCAESLALGACPVLGYDQARMDALIEVDGTSEFTLYLAAVGVRA